MHKSPAMKLLVEREILSQKMRAQMANNFVNSSSPFSNKLAKSGGGCDVFINHRGVDTKRTVASLLYDHLFRLGIRPFLDNKNMKPGDKLFEKINSGIMGCKVGVLVFSPSYCKSYFCLHELALMMEFKKKIVPIFCDVKPSELRVVDKGSCSEGEVERFTCALEQAKYTVGLDFDSSKGNWSDVVNNAADIVVERLFEIEEEELLQNNQIIQLPSY